jgi:hypothetical protein
MTVQHRHTPKPLNVTRHWAHKLCGVILFACAALVNPASPVAQAADSAALKRSFLDRYLDCAEAPSARARLQCFDMLLIDIPAWLDEPADPLYVSFQLPSRDVRPKRLEKKQNAQ